MHETKLAESARELVAEALGIDVGIVSLQSDMESFEYWTSIKHIQIIQALEA